MLALHHRDSLSLSRIYKAVLVIEVVALDATSLHQHAEHENKKAARVVSAAFHRMRA